MTKLLFMMSLSLFTTATFGASDNVCDRAPVIVEFLELTLKKKCGEIGATDLAQVKRLYIAGSKVQLSDDDFTGLVNLKG